MRPGGPQPTCPYPFPLFPAHLQCAAGLCGTVPNQRLAQCHHVLVVSVGLVQLNGRELQGRVEGGVEGGKEYIHVST